MSALKAMLVTPEAPELGPGPRAGVQSVARVNEMVDSFLQNARLGPDTGELVRALILLWHDHLDEAHQIAQGVGTANGSLVHGIMHRREPDYGNAKYWLHRAGRHPCLIEIGRHAVDLLGAKGEDALRKELTPHNLWDAAEFVDACEDAARNPGRNQRNQLLRDLQRIETETLLEYFSRNPSSAGQD
jgi:hypothetical protein